MVFIAGLSQKLTQFANFAGPRPGLLADQAWVVCIPHISGLTVIESN